MSFSLISHSLSRNAMSVSEPMFARFIGIDYSGAENAHSRLKGLSVYQASWSELPTEVPPVDGKATWSRALLADWLLETLSDGPPTLVGIDHAFSFPIRYFEVHHIPPDWDVFLDDFCKHWPTDEPNVNVEFVREGVVGMGPARGGSSRWQRYTEQATKGAKSVFHFSVPGSVAKSTHAGLPWLRLLRHELRDRLHFWPFDGWSPPKGKSVVAEVYPRLWKHLWPKELRDDHQHDAYVTARWMREADACGELKEWFTPANAMPRKGFAEVEGWILGVE